MKVAYYSICPWDFEHRGIDDVINDVISQLNNSNIGDTITGGDIISFTETNGNFNSPNYSLPAAIDKV